MSFNPDPCKQAQKAIFSRKQKKKKKKLHPPLFFNNSNISQITFQKHLGIIIDIQLTYEEHLK